MRKVLLDTIQLLCTVTCICALSNWKLLLYVTYLNFITECATTTLPRERVCKPSNHRNWVQSYKKATSYVYCSTINGTLAWKFCSKISSTFIKYCSFLFVILNRQLLGSVNASSPHCKSVGIFLLFWSLPFPIWGSLYALSPLWNKALSTTLGNVKLTFVNYLWFKVISGRF